jgi:hypothetical protein
MVVTSFQKASSLIWEGMGSADLSSAIAKTIALMQTADSSAVFKKVLLEIMFVIIGGAYQSSTPICPTLLA